jgi:hypothetical protein
MGVINHVERAPMTRAERWAKEDQERQLHQIGKPPEPANVMTAAVVGYFAYKAGEAFGDAVSSALDNTDSSSDD